MEADSQDDAEENSESEENKTDDEPVEDDLASKVSRSSCTRFAPKPALDLGTLGAVSAPKAKAKQKSRKKKGEKEDSELGDSVLDSGDASADLVKDALSDPKLKLVADALGHVPKCFVALQPGKLLTSSAKIGHQAKGVGVRRKNCDRWCWMK